LLGQRDAQEVPHVSVITEIRAGLETSILGISTIIGPVLFFLGIFGVNALEPALWATLVTATAARAVRLLTGQSAALLSSSRAASLAAYVGLVYLLTHALSDEPVTEHAFTTPQLLLGLIAGSLMFALASGLVLLCGMLKLGNAFKMIPSTVTAGISNSIALLLVWLAVKQVVHEPAAVAWVPIAMVLCLYGWPRLQRRIRGLKVFPTVLIAVAAGLAMGWFAQNLPHTTPGFPTLSLAWVPVGQWYAFVAQTDVSRLLLVALPGTITLALVMILESFTAANQMETRTGLRFDANRELSVLGGSNLISAVVGGVPCTASPLISLANHAYGGRGWRAAASNWWITAALLLALAPWLLVLPTGIVAGLYLLQAPPLVDPAFAKRLASMLRTRQLRREGTGDLGFWITLTITLVGFFGSLIWACFVGIGLSCLAVLRRVSNKLDAQWAYLDQYRSHRVRTAGALASLELHSRSVGILRLTGHLFFGNSRRLTQMVDELDPEATAVVVDVSQVHDVDSSGSDALSWLVNALRERDLTLVLTGLQRTPSVELRHTLGSIQGITTCADLDRGLELCEEQLLQRTLGSATSPSAIAVEDNALLKGLSSEEITGVLLLGDRRNVDKGEMLFRKDTLADGVWLLEAGTVSILSGAADDGLASRLATFGPGQFVGEMSLIDGRPRSATVIADTPVHALLLDAHAITALEQRYPVAALNITRNIALELSRRVRSSSALMAEAHTEKSSEWANSALSTLSRF
jgi:MFS superfamily sulfate permease-like transporter/CRP-like cAMP-binding protein